MSKHERPEPDSHRKFREALDRKNDKANSGTAHRDGGAGQSKSHGPMESKRNFRRKSG